MGRNGLGSGALPLQGFPNSNLRLYEIRPNAPRPPTRDAWAFGAAEIPGPHNFRSRYAQTPALRSNVQMRRFLPRTSMKRLLLGSNEKKMAKTRYFARP